MVPICFLCFRLFFEYSVLLNFCQDFPLHKEYHKYTKFEVNGKSDILTYRYTRFVVTANDLLFDDKEIIYFPSIYVLCRVVLYFDMFEPLHPPSMGDYLQINNTDVIFPFNIHLEPCHLIASVSCHHSKTFLHLNISRE